MNRRIKPIAAAVGTAFVACAAGTAIAEVQAENPFVSTDLGLGYQLAGADEGKCGEGKCGEGKCGEAGTEADAEGKAEGEGKCGEGKCGEAKDEGEGKCGEGKCGESTSDAKAEGEGKCGEGKSGG